MELPKNMGKTSLDTNQRKRLGRAATVDAVIDVRESQGGRGVHLEKIVLKNSQGHDDFDSSSDEKYDELYSSDFGPSSEDKKEETSVVQIDDDPRAQEKDNRSDSGPTVTPELVRASSSRRAAAAFDIMQMAPVLEDLKHPEDPERRKILQKQQREYISRVAQSPDIGIPKVLAERMKDLPYYYLPLRRLSSQGAMGTVYEVVDLGFDKRRLVMKVFQGGAPRLFERFKQEARLAASIRNPHVAQIISADFAPDGSAGWYVMEKAVGRDLNETMGDAAMALPDALEMMAQTADGLATVHAKGIVHRDLKPANIIVHQEYDQNQDPMTPVYKLIDFGLAKQVEVEEGKLDWVRNQMINAASAEQLDASLQKYGFSDSQRASAVEVYKSFQSSDEVAKLMDKDWKRIMAKSRRDSTRLESIRMFAAQLPRGNKDLAYDLYLASIERAKREWVRSEIDRLATLEKPTARLLRMLKPFKVPGGVITEMVALAKQQKEDPQSVSPEEIALLAEEISIDQELSALHAVIGTPAYMSPEQVRGGILDTKSDVFSLGVVWYEAVSGTNPNKGKNVQQTLFRVQTQEPPELSTVIAVPPRLSTLIARMLDKDPAQRPTMKEVKTEIAAIRAQYVHDQATERKPRERTPESEAATNIVEPAPVPVAPGEAHKKGLLDRLKGFFGR